MGQRLCQEPRIQTWKKEPVSAILEVTHRQVGTQSLKWYSWIQAAIVIETDLLGTLGNDLSAEKEGGGQGGNYLQITWNS